MYEAGGAFVQGWAAAFSPAYRRAILEETAADPQIRLLVEEGLSEIGGLDIANRTILSAMQPDDILRAPLVGDINLPENAKLLVAAQKRANDFFEAVNGGLFDGLHPKVIDYVAKSLSKQIAELHPEWTARQVAAEAAKASNVITSTIPEWQSVLAPRLRQLGRGLYFSPNETEGWFRQTLGALLPSKTGALYRTQWLGYGIFAAFWAETINLAFTGHLLDPSQYVPIIRNPDTGAWGYNTQFMRPQLAGDGPAGQLHSFRGPAGRSLFLDLLGQGDTPLRFLAAPSFAIKSRASTPVNTLYSIVRGKTMFGNQPITRKGMLPYIATEMGVPIPASGALQERTTIGLPGAVIQATGWNVSGEHLADLRNRIAKQDYPKSADVQRNGFAGLTPAQEIEYYLNHPELKAAGEQAVKDAANRGQRWALYRLETDARYNDYNALLQTGAGETPEQQRDLYNAARTALGTQLALVDRQYADVVKTNEERRAKHGPANEVERLLGERSDIYARFEDPATGITPEANKEAMYQALDAWEARLTPGQRQAVDINTGLREVPQWVTTYRKEMGTLKNYWRLADDTWATMRENFPELGRFATVDDYRAEVERSIVQQGLYGIMSPDRDPFLSMYNRATSTAHQMYLLDNPSANAVLTKWYGRKALTPEAQQLAQAGAEQTYGVQPMVTAAAQ
jgi:hypothetical protein